MPGSIAAKYVIFAVFATATNILGQDLSIRLYDGAYGIGISILVGTFAGLILKYYLDKHYIFQFKARDLSHDTSTFVLYTLMGVITTLIFWSTELAFHYLFGTKGMRYLGAVIGLAIGYLIKYRLDKRYVFRSD